MILNNVVLKIIEEQNINTSKTRPIINAIKNRNKISFYYKGPTRPKKTGVKPGYRIKAEAVALGLSKKGNLLIRAFVKPPSTSKKGFAKTGWRTFMVSRISGLQITDEVFNEKRPGYNEGDDRTFSVTYVKTDWGTKSEPKPVEKPTPQPKPVQEPTTKVEPAKTELPQPKPVEKPQAEPTPQVEKPEPEELPQPKPEEKPSENPEENEDENLMENIKRIKGLMLLLN
jgi:cell division septation protein DedD